MSRFDGKVALVTGGRSGIGQAIARRLRADGARVFTAQRGADVGFEVINADLSDSAAPQAIIDAVIEHGGRLDILVNNAGVMQEALAEEMTLAEWEQTLRINLTAPFLLIKAALPNLRATKGNIINIGSIEGLGANPAHAAYCASKAGLHGLTQQLRLTTAATASAAMRSRRAGSTRNSTRILSTQRRTRRHSGKTSGGFTRLGEPESRKK